MKHPRLVLGLCVGGSLLMALCACAESSATAEADDPPREFIMPAPVTAVACTGTEGGGSYALSTDPKCLVCSGAVCRVVDL